MTKKIINDLDEVTLREYVASVNSKNKVLKLMGINSRNGRYIKALEERLIDLGIDYSHFNINATPVFDLSEVLIENSTYNNQTLKKRLISEGLLSYKCSICGNEGTWNGLPLVLQLDHINGINSDNQLHNLRFLCPNCHSQTSTFGGRNLRK